MARHDDWFTLFDGQLIKDARGRRHETQEELAEYMEVDVRTVCNWETGRTTPGQKYLPRLVEHLSLLSEQLRLVDQTDFTQQTARYQLRQAKSYFDAGRFMGARSICQVLESNLARQVSSGEQSLLPLLAYAQYFAGHASSITVDDYQAACADARLFFAKLEKVARELQDNNWLWLSLTYQAEMYRRQNMPERALDLLTKMPPETGVDVFIKGNWAQLLARTYGKLHVYDKAGEALRLAEELSFQEDKRTSDIYVCYNTCGVYEEYARIYMHSDPEESRRYNQLAEECMPSASRWQVPVLFTRGETLIYLAMRAEVKRPEAVLETDEYKQGIEHVLKAVELAQEFGHKRQLWRAGRLLKQFRDSEAKSNRVAQDLTEMLRQSNLLPFGDGYL